MYTRSCVLDTRVGNCVGILCTICRGARCMYTRYPGGRSVRVYSVRCTVSRVLWQDGQVNVYSCLCTVCNPELTNIHDHHVIIHYDNTPTLYALSKLLVKSVPLRMTVQKMAQVAMGKRFEPAGIYIPSQLNIADGERGRLRPDV
jgi:hypothetical protein